MRRGASSLLIVIAVLILVFVLAALGSRGPRVAAGAAGGQQTILLPSVQKFQELNKLTLRPEIAGFGNETPVAITHAGDSRLFVATQSGSIYVFQRDPLTYEITGMSTFLDLSSTVNVSFEEGLLGLAFHPNYVGNGWFYVTYSEFGSGRIILARYSRSADPNVADPNSRLIMLAIDKPPNPPDDWPLYSAVHNAGQIHFGPDGYFYMATGDGGPDPHDQGPPWPADPYNHGQRRDVLLGKILRIDVNQVAPLPPNCGGTGYTIPADNPFADGSGGFCDEIWSYGWRNPWRFSFDPLTGNMYVADVGEWQLEEVNMVPAGVGGLNYGWHCFEGIYDHRNASHIAGDCSDQTSSYTFPFFVWDRTQGCSGIGGYVYRGNYSPVMRGYYLFADFCSRYIWAANTENLTGDVRKPLLVIENGGIGAPQWTSFGVDVRGEIYIGGFAHNAIYRISAP